MIVYLLVDCYEVEKKKKKKYRKALKKKKQKSWNNVVLISDVCWCETCDE